MISTIGAAFGDARIVGVTGGTSTPIEDLERVAERVYALAGTEDAQSRPCGSAHLALTAVAEPAYRRSSPGRSPATRAGALL